MHVDEGICHGCGRPSVAHELDGLCLRCLLRAGRTPEYAILTIIGRGASGTTYLAQQAPGGTVVVCKILNSRVTSLISPAALDAYRHRLATFSHPNAAGAMDVGRTAGEAFVVRPYVAGV